jgi:hypothetical protein
MTLSARGAAVQFRSRIEQRKKLKPDSSTISIRAGSGLGDSLYLQSVARHLVETGHKVEVCSNWRDVFDPLKGKIVLSGFRREYINRVAHYTGRKGNPTTDQFQDCCISAGITDPVDLRLDWEVRNKLLIETVRKSGKPVVLVQLPRSPMARTDGFGAELLPDCRVIQAAIDSLKGRAFVVQVGSGVPLFRFKGIDLDLANRTMVRDLIDLASQADGFLGYCSFIIPLAESFSKPALLVWSRRGLNSTAPRGDFIRAITPQKVLHRKESSKFIIDDCAQDDVTRAAHELLDASAGR